MNTRAALAGMIAALAVAAMATAQVAHAQGAYQRPTPQRVPSGTSSNTRTSGDVKKAEEVYAQLLRAAQDDVANRHYAEGAKAYEQAVEVGESLYGKDDPRLVPALSGIVYAQMSWDSYAAMAGGKKGDVGDAVRAQERVVKIYGDDGTDAKTRVSSMIDLGDVYLYTDNERALEIYREAWQLQSKLESAESADALFAKPGVVRLQLPANPPGHEEWVATVHYDVGADGRATVTEVGGNPPESLATDIRTSYTNARFRPRFAGGEPIATTGLGSSHKYIAAR
jgi:tetratricopeptide (TPR) repeat protein